MMNKTITQDQYNELCSCGKLAFTNHNLWLITWLTFYKMVVVCEDVRTGEFELIHLEIEKVEE